MSKCENCIHYDVCNGALLYPKANLNCEHYKDKSLCVELPCKVGDEVYIIGMKHYCHACKIKGDSCHISCPFKDDMKKSDVFKGQVFAILIGEKEGNNEICMECEQTQFLNTRNVTRLFDDFGKRIFLTKEEAEAKLEEMRE